MCSKHAVMYFKHCAGAETYEGAAGMVPSKIVGGGDGDAYVPPKFQKYLIKYKFLVFPLFILALVLCVWL